MPTAIKNNITEAVRTTATKYPCIYRIGVFGSYARGDYNLNSDIDLLYDYDNNMIDSSHQFLSFVEDLLDMIRPLEADFVYIKNLLETEDEFMSNVLNDVVWIYNSYSNAE